MNVFLQFNPLNFTHLNKLYLMKDIRLIKILKSFSEEELKSFKKFLDSPYNKSRRNILPFFDIIIKYFPEFNSTGLERENIYKHIFPGEKYNEKKIQNFIFDLTKALESFLTHNAMESDEIDSLLYLCKGYYDKGLLMQAMRVLNSVEQKLEPGFSSSKDFFTRHKKVYKLKCAFYSETNDFQKLEELQNEIFEMSAIQFLMDYTWMMCEKETASSTYYKRETGRFADSIVKSFDIDKFINLIDKFNMKLSPLTALHFYILKTIEEPENPEHYFRLKKLFYKDISNYDREEKFNAFVHLINYCGEKISKFGEDYSEEMFGLYKNMLKNNAYSISDNEFLQIADFRNIMRLAEISSDHKFLDMFIENYSFILNPEQREDLIMMMKAVSSFMNGEFEISLTFLSKIRKEMFIFKSDIKILKLRLFYELNYNEQAHSLLDSFKHLNSKNETISDAVKKNNKNFINAYQELLNIKSGKATSLYAVKKILPKLSRYQYSDWIKKKAGDFGKI